MHTQGQKQIADLVMNPPLTLTLGAEFKAGGSYTTMHTLYNGDKVKVMRMGGTCVSMEPTESLVSPRQDVAAPKSNMEMFILTPRTRYVYVCMCVDVCMYVCRKA